MSAKKSFFVLPILSLICLFSSICGTAEAKSVSKIGGFSTADNSTIAPTKELIPNQQAGAVSGSTSPYVVSTEVHRTQQEGQDSNIITFSEFPLGTYITDQYSNRGIIFGGDSPFISPDGANPTSPVLSGTPLFQGAIEGRFVNPNNGITPITVSSFSLDAGYFDVVGTTRIEWFDRYDNKLGEQINSALGIEHFVIEGGGIARWRFAIITSEPAGFAIDNVSIDFSPVELTKVDDVDDGNCVGPGDEINYRIDYNYPAGPNYLDINDGNIIDYLPPEIDFNSASAGGVYDSNSNTVTWYIGTLHPGDKGFVTLKVKVKCAQPGITITNCCEIKSGGIVYDTAYEHTPVCSPTLTKIDDVPNGSCVVPDVNITYSICYAANGYGDTNVVIIDSLPNEVNYVSSDPCGSYNPGPPRTVTWYIGDLPPNGSDCFELVVQVNTKAESLGTITNCCRMTGGCIDINDCESTRVCCWYRPVIYVDANATGSNNGTSWENAYNYLQDALEDARMGGPCAEIWVAAGTYKPDCNSTFPSGSGDLTATFSLINNVAIYGGFPRGGGVWENRNPSAYETILSGDIGCNKNSDHVVTGSNTNETAVLDGFTITGGNNEYAGGGMYNSSGSPTITNCTFSGNLADSGGGMYSSGNPTIINCIFTGNSASGEDGVGGGMYSSGNPTIINCIFTENSAMGQEDYGGGMYSSGNPTIINCIFTGNSADYGGGLYTYGNPTITNCTFSGNTANSYGGGMYNSGGSPTITNCILWDNTASNGPQIYNGGSLTVGHSDIQGSWAGQGNINKDPRLTADGYHLRCWCSPCVDAGTNTPPGGLPPEDIDGEDRTIDGNCDGEAIVDMGADEYYLADCNILARAHCPNPACGTTDVPVGTVLRWSPGKYAAFHDVYLGADFNDVNNASRTDPCGVLVNQNQEPNYYPAASLMEFDTTYYWRIDEVNNKVGTPPGSPWKGDVWWFTTANYLVVEDFNSYMNTNALRAVWRKVAGSAGSQVSLETAIVRSDNSMKYDFNNVKSPFYTEASANTTGPNSLQVTQDWTTADIKSLVLYFYGNGTNAAEKMYVALRSTDNNLAVVYYGGDPNKPWEDPNDLNEPQWHEWNIELSDFKKPKNVNDVNLSNVNKVYIGFGNRENPAADGSGSVYFDDIRLYPTRCVAAFAPEGDLDNDCIVDFVDVNIMAGDWLDRDANGKGADATLKGGATWVNDDDRGWCVQLNGDNGNDDWVNLDDSDFSNFRNKTIVFWVKIRNYPPCGTDYQYMFYFSDESETPYRIYFMTDTSNVRVRFVGDYSKDFIAGKNNWCLLALSIKDTDDGLCKGTFYAFNGNPLDGVHDVNEFVGRPRHSGGAIGVNLGSENDGAAGHINAVFDDFRVYNYALSWEEIMYLAGTSVGSGGDPVPPDDNLMLLHYTFDEGAGTIAANSSNYQFYRPLTSVAELYDEEPQGQRAVNFRDFAILADNWLEERRWP